MVPLVRFGLVALTLAAAGSGCGGSAKRATGTPRELRHRAGSPGAGRQTEECPGPLGAERLEIARGGATTSSSGIVISLSEESWSLYQDGTFEVTASLGFKEPSGAIESELVDLLAGTACGIALGRRWKMSTTRDGHTILELATSSGCSRAAMTLDEARRRTDAFARAWLADRDVCEWRTFEDFRVTARAVSEPATECYRFIVSYDEIERCREAFDAADSPRETRAATFANCEDRRRRARARCDLPPSSPFPTPHPGLDVIVGINGELRERPRR